MRFALDSLLLVFTLLLMGGAAAIFLFLLWLAAAYLTYGIGSKRGWWNERNGGLAAAALALLAYILALPLQAAVACALLFFFLYARAGWNPRQKWTCTAAVLGSSLFVRMGLPSWQEWLVFAAITALTLWQTSTGTQQARLRFGALALFAAGSTLLLGIVPLLRSITSFLVWLAASGTGALLGPLFQSFGVRHEQKLNENLAKLQQQQPPQTNWEHTSTAYNPLVYYGATAVCILLAIILLYRRWRRFKSPEHHAAAALPAFASISRQPRHRKQKPPASLVRKELFHLEKALKPPLSRQRGETAAAWLQRLRQAGLSFREETVLTAYEQERYGLSPCSEEQYAQLKQETKRIRAQQKTPLR